MPVTPYPQGLSSFGVTLPASSFTRANGRKHLWVHGQYGNDGNDGLSPGAPLKTMARAFVLIESGGTIHLNGTVLEQLSTPVGIFDVTIIGEGNLPRHADAHTSSTLTFQGGRSAATWKPPAAPAAATPLLVVRQQGWRFVNLLFVPAVDDAAIELVRDGGAGNLERDASHTEVIGCRFAGGQDGILCAGASNVFDVRISNCVFNDQTGVSIKGTLGAQYRWIIDHNTFGQNASHIVATLTQSYVINNVMGQWTTASIDLNGGAGLNTITGNYLSGTYASTQYRKANANDDWGGNWSTGVGTLTVNDPA